MRCNLAVSGIMYRLTSFCFHPVIRFRRSVPFCKYMYIPYLTTILESRYVAMTLRPSYKITHTNIIIVLFSGQLHAG